MKERKINNLRIILTMAIAAFSITLIHNLNIDVYVKDFIIPIVILLISYIYTINAINLKISKLAYYCLIPIILILLSNFIINIDGTNIILNMYITPILLSIFFLKLTNKNYTISRNFLRWFFKLFPKNLFKNLKTVPQDLQNKIKINKSKTISIIKGICIGLPLSLILLNLLTRADVYFNTFIEKITNNAINPYSFSNFISNTLLFIITFAILFSTFINIIENKDAKITIKFKKSNRETATTILIIINTIFFLFLISEISKVTVNFLHIPKEYTYAKYAREGFFQLLIVTAINFSIIAYYLYYTNITKENKLIKNLIITLIGFSILLILDSYYRMFLYINSYGFTTLRLQVILFLLMELILFIILIKKMIKGLKHKDAIIFTIIILSTYIINLYTCNNSLITAINKLINK